MASEPRVNAAMLAALEGRVVTLLGQVSDAPAGGAALTVTASDKKPVAVALAGGAAIDAPLAAGHWVDVTGVVQNGKVVAVRPASCARDAGEGSDGCAAAAQPRGRHGPRKTQPEAWARVRRDAARHGVSALARRGTAQAPRRGVAWCGAATRGVARCDAARRRARGAARPSALRREALRDTSRPDPHRAPAAFELPPRFSPAQRALLGPAPAAAEPRLPPAVGH